MPSESFHILRRYEAVVNYPILMLSLFTYTQHIGQGKHLFTIYNHCHYYVQPTTTIICNQLPLLYTTNAHPCNFVSYFQARLKIQERDITHGPQHLVLASQPSSLQKKDYAFQECQHFISTIGILFSSLVLDFCVIQYGHGWSCVSSIF